MNIIFKTTATFLSALTLICCGQSGRAVSGNGQGEHALAQSQPSYARTISMDSGILGKGNAADTIKLGRIGEGAVVSHNLKIENNDSVPLVITGVDLTCGCVQVDYPKPPVRPGESAVMEMTFDSKGQIGWVYKTVLVKTSLSQRPFTLVITAQVE